MKLFYDHLVMIDDVVSEIELLEVDVSTKEKAKKTVDEIINHHIFIHILNLLPSKHHEEFLKRFHKKPHDITHLNFIQRNIQVDIQSEIILLSQKVKRELKKEIKKHRKK